MIKFQLTSTHVYRCLQSFQLPGPSPFNVQAKDTSERIKGPLILMSQGHLLVGATPFLIALNSLRPSQLHVFPNQWSLIPSFYITALFLKVWSLEQQDKQHLGTCERYRFSGFTPQLMNHKLGLKNNDLCLNKASREFWSTVKFENHCSRDWDLSWMFVMTIVDSSCINSHT